MTKQATYQGVFEPTADGGFSVYFPDLPGCVSYGDTLSEAQRNARDALGLHLYGLEKDGEPIPAPSAAPEIDPETAPGYLVFPVTASPSLIRDELDNQRVGINMDINETTLKSMDDAENDKNLRGSFDNVAEMMEALNA